MTRPWQPTTQRFQAVFKLFGKELRLRQVTEVPSVVIQPLGLKPDGSYYDKTDMATWLDGTS